MLDQINLFIDLIRDHKNQIVQTAMMKNDKIDGSVLEIGEVILPEEIPEAESIKEMLDFYAKK